MFKFNAKFNADSLLYLLSHFECDGHTVHMLSQQPLPPPLTSTVRLSLFMRMHSSPLSLAAKLYGCHANHSHYVNNGWTFSGQTYSLHVSNNSSPGIHPREIKIYIHTKTCRWTFITTILVIVKSVKHPNVHHWWPDKQNAVYSDRGMSGSKKEWSTDARYSMDGPWKHYAKWKRSGIKDHILYDYIVCVGKAIETGSRLVALRVCGERRMVGSREWLFEYSFLLG